MRQKTNLRIAPATAQPVNAEQVTPAPPVPLAELHARMINAVADVVEHGDTPPALSLTLCQMVGELRTLADSTGYEQLNGAYVRGVGLTALRIIQADFDALNS